MFVAGSARSGSSFGWCGSEYLGEVFLKGVNVFLLGFSWIVVDGWLSGVGVQSKKFLTNVIVIGEFNGWLSEFEGASDAILLKTVLDGFDDGCIFLFLCACGGLVVDGGRASVPKRAPISSPSQFDSIHQCLGEGRLTSSWFGGEVRWSVEEKAV